MDLVQVAHTILHEADGDECHEFLEEKLGQFISTAEKSRVTEFRDSIAEAMWAQYIIDGEDDNDGLWLYYGNVYTMTKWDYARINYGIEIML